VVPAVRLDGSAASGDRVGAAEGDGAVVGEVGEFVVNLGALDDPLRGIADEVCAGRRAEQESSGLALRFVSQHDGPYGIGSGCGGDVDFDLVGGRVAGLDEYQVGDAVPIVVRHQPCAIAFGSEGRAGLEDASLVIRRSRSNVDFHCAGARVAGLDEYQV